MKSGFKCCRVKVLAGLLTVGLMGLAWWWWKQPRTMAELFQVRCSSCHELRTRRLCEFTPELRPLIVQVMRQQHGADQVINATEAVRIENYLRDEFRCQ